MRTHPLNHQKPKMFCTRANRISVIWQMGTERPFFHSLDKCLWGAYGAGTDLTATTLYC